MMGELWPDLPLAERQRRKFAMEQAEKPAAEKAEPRILEPAAFVPPSSLPKQAKDIVALLEGRQIAAKRSKSLVEGAVYKSGAKAGQKRADKVQDNYAIATTDKKYPVVYAAWVADALIICKVAPEPGVRVEFTNITELKKFLKGALNGAGD